MVVASFSILYKNSIIGKWFQLTQSSALFQFATSVPNADMIVDYECRAFEVQRFLQKSPDYSIAKNVSLTG